MEHGNQDSKITLIQEVLSLIQLMEECGQELCALLTEPADSGAVDTLETRCQSLFNDLFAGITGLLQCSTQLEGRLNHAYYSEMVENIDAVLSDAAEQINADHLNSAAHVLRFQLLPFLKELWEEVYFWGIIYPDPEKMNAYYRDEFVQHHENEFLAGRNDAYLPKKNKFSTFKYKFSIFIPVFNKLEYTKQCINAIVKHTALKKYSCEFILLNDGSSDGTQDYLESLDLGVDKKVIFLRKNVKTLIFSLAFRVCEGEYFIFVNNDTLVTKGWLDNLLACMESDPRLISATPCTPNTSNFQIDMEGRYSFATPEDTLRHVNHSDSTLWEVRARIMPVIAMYRTELVNRIGFADRLFYTMEFWDDDFSLRARRAGYRQMLCRDTYCHHFGSVTGKAGQVKENTLEKGRALFRLKHQVDAWGDDFCYDYQALSFLKSSPLPDPSFGKDAEILGIDCGFGDTLLQIKSYLQGNGRRTMVSALADNDSPYSEDMKAISDHFYQTKFVCDTLKNLSDAKFDYIYLQRPLEVYQDYDRLLRLIYEKLKPEGLLFFKITNLYYKPFLENALNLSFPNGNDSIRFLNMAFLQSRLKNTFSQMNCIAQQEAVTGIEDFKRFHMKGCTNPSADLLLSSRYLKFCCRK